MDNKHADKTTILFLCTGNSCRSQMAEAWANSLRGDEWQASSAGIEVHGMNPLAIKVMAESRLDITSQYSKTYEQLKNKDFDVVVSPSFNGGNQLLATNLTGQPVVVVPNGFKKDGSPTSISFLANLFDEGTALAVAAAYQEASSFNKKMPPLFSQ